MEEQEQLRLAGVAQGVRVKAKPPRATSPGQHLVAFFVDECVEQGKPDMVKLLKGPVAQRVGILLRDGCEVEEIEAGLRELVRREAPNAMRLHDIMVEQARTERATAPNQDPVKRRAAQAWIQENGWPTGVLHLRGSHGIQEVYDPLGVERLKPYDWPHGRPDFNEIVDTLVERKLI